MSVVHKWQVAACDGDYCAAMLLSFFEYWHNIKETIADVNNERNARMEGKGSYKRHPVSLWQYHTMDGLMAGILQAYSINKVRAAKGLLVSKGFVQEKDNEVNKWDKTKLYLFDVVNVSAYVQKWSLDPTNMEDRSPINVGCYTKIHTIDSSLVQPSVDTSPPQPSMEEEEEEEEEEDEVFTSNPTPKDKGAHVCASGGYEAGRTRYLLTDLMEDGVGEITPPDPKDPMTATTVERFLRWSHIEKHGLPFFTPLTLKGKGQCGLVLKRAGSGAYAVLFSVFSEWGAYTLYLEGVHAVEKAPEIPNIGFLLEHIDKARLFSYAMEEEHTEDSLNTPIVYKPVTTTTCAPKNTAMSKDEFLAMEDDDAPD